MMQSFDLEMLFYAFLTPHFFLKNEMQMFRIIFFFRSHSCKHTRNVVEMGIQENFLGFKTKDRSFRNIYQETPSHVV